VKISGPTANFDITGIAGGMEGRPLLLYNTTTLNMTLKHENASSEANNRFSFVGGADVPTVGIGMVSLVYVNSRWVDVSLRP
jgi:hypothetical protein